MIEFASPQRKGLLSPLLAEQVHELPVKGPFSGTYYTVKENKVAATVQRPPSTRSRAAAAFPQPTGLAHRWRFIKQEVFDSNYSPPPALRNRYNTTAAPHQSPTPRKAEQQSQQKPQMNTGAFSRRPSTAVTWDEFHRSDAGTHTNHSPQPSVWNTPRGLLERALEDDNDVELPLIQQVVKPEPATRGPVVSRPPSRSSVSPVSSTTTATETHHPETTSSSTRTIWPNFSVTHSVEEKATNGPSCDEDPRKTLELLTRTPVRIGSSTVEFTSCDDGSRQSPGIRGAHSGLLPGASFTDQAQRLRVTLLTSAYQKMVDDLVEMHEYTPSEREAIYRHVSIFRELPLQSRYHEMHPLVNMRLAKVEVRPRQLQRKSSFNAVETHRGRTSRSGSRTGRRGSAWRRLSSVGLGSLNNPDKGSGNFLRENM
ncbi:uncharacterized protein TEOVI_000357200 [Trypanosoma equiperdum]|uniref:Uncharacterized protein n=2 Tax=Trypanozoon TaxID=39700 RepID=Q57X57_TRYB2|nr:hypothetical protein, conserved [Trypanosoma brucei brucei TREU927]AAX69812.1 hypothetical protein, conserved [Trypanosoma brucei]AAZ12505.1 hypothetical protein, conserved [Trypanosoma brucei brucei TREU927]SCU71990.1 hypothetical protein, conserved [Trypanosoma equiperdum]